MTIMVGGFMGIGTPSRLVEALLEYSIRDLTLIANDTAFVGYRASVHSHRQWSSPQSDCFTYRHQPGNRSAHDIW
ncbi:CoA-transferase [Shigella flexneri]